MAFELPGDYGPDVGEEGHGVGKFEGMEAERRGVEGEVLAQGGTVVGVGGVQEEGVLDVGDFVAPADPAGRLLGNTNMPGS